MGARIRQLRKGLRLSTKELSERLGVSVGFLGLIERDVRNPSSKNIAKLCEVFNVSYDYLVFGKDGTDKKIINSSAGEALNEDELNFVTAIAKTAIYHRFSKDDLELLLHAITIHAKNLSLIRKLHEQA